MSDKEVQEIHMGPKHQSISIIIKFHHKSLPSEEYFNNQRRMGLSGCQSSPSPNHLGYCSCCSWPGKQWWKSLSLTTTVENLKCCNAIIFKTLICGHTKYLVASQPHWTHCVTGNVVIFPYQTRHFWDWILFPARPIMHGLTEGLIHCYGVYPTYRFL